MSNHLKDLAEQMETVALELDDLDRNVAHADGTLSRTQMLRQAVDVLDGIPCQHNAVATTDDQEDSKDVLVRYVCQFCQKELVQTWMVKP